ATGLLGLAVLGLLAGIILRIARKDGTVVEIPVSPGDKIELVERPQAAGPAMVRADKDRPFVLRRGDKAVRDYRTFGEAFTELQAGDVIEVDGNGPFHLDGLEVIDRPLTLRATAGRRPFFVVPRAIKAEGVPMTIEGCDFDGRRANDFLTGGGAPWEFRNCR